MVLRTWSRQKKAWCCTYQNVACHSLRSRSEAGPDAAKRFALQGLGCLKGDPSSTAPKSPSDDEGGSVWLFSLILVLAVIVTYQRLKGGFCTDSSRRSYSYGPAGTTTYGRGGNGVVVPPDGPYPPQCYGGDPLQVRGSRGEQVKPQESLDMFAKTLMRPVRYSFIEDFELPASNNDVVQVRRYELNEEGLRQARLAFNCDAVFKSMSESGVLNRGSDCDVLPGMFDLTAASNNIPYERALAYEGFFLP
eukprot:s208_g13.t1